MASVITGFIPTRASLLRNKNANDYQEVSYVSNKPKEKKKTKPEDIDPDGNSQQNLDIKKVKHEIAKFSMEGFDPMKKEEAKIQLAIKLGAKPPKNKYKNYKVLMRERKQEKNKLEAQQKFQQLGKNATGKSTAKGKSFDRKRRKEGILDVYGKVTKELRQQKGKKR